MIRGKLFLNTPVSFIALVGLMLAIHPLHSHLGSFALIPSFDLNQHLREPWRILSAHLAHASWMHLALNLINLFLLRWVFQEWMSNKMFIVFLLYSGAFISTGLCLIDNLQSYVGFSGIFYALVIFLLLLNWSESPAIFTVAILAIIAKILYEQAFGANDGLIDLIGINIAIDSHALGLVSGITFYCIFSLNKHLHIMNKV